MRINSRLDIAIKEYVESNGYGVQAILPCVDVDEVVDAVGFMDLKFMKMNEFNNYVCVMKELESCIGISNYLGVKSIKEVKNIDVARAKGYMQVIQGENDIISKAMAKHVVSCIYVTNKFSDYCEFRTHGIQCLGKTASVSAKMVDRAFAEELFDTQMLYMMSDGGWQKYDPSRTSFSNYALLTLYRPHSPRINASLQMYSRVMVTDELELQKPVIEPDFGNENMDEIKALILKKKILSEEAYDVMVAYSVYRDMDYTERLAVGNGALSLTNYIRNAIGQPDYSDSKINNIIYHAQEKLRAALTVGDKKYCPQLKELLGTNRTIPEKRKELTK